MGPRLDAFARFLNAAISFFLSLRVNCRPHGTTRSPAGRIFVKFYVRDAVTNMRRENSRLVRIGRKSGTSFYEDLLKFIVALITNFTVVAVGGTR